MSRKSRCASNPVPHYWTIAVPVFALACVAGAPFIGALAIAIFWLIPAVLRTRDCRSQAVVASSDRVSLTKTPGPQMPVG